MGKTLTRLAKLWSLTTGALIYSTKLHSKGINDMILVDNYIMSCSEDQTMKVFDIDKLSLMHNFEFPHETHTVILYDYSPGRRIILIGDNKGVVYFFDFDKGFEINSR